jgi:hypothetical protein
MFEETAEHSELHSEPGSESQSGCDSQHGTPTVIDNTPASEQTLSDDQVRARNKAVRGHHRAPGAGVVPPFSDHSGSL